MSAVRSLPFRVAGRVMLGAVCVLAAAPLASAQPVPPVRLSVSTAGVEANGASNYVDLTPDGRVVLFVSQASNLVDGDTNAAIDLFLRDRDLDSDGVFDEAGAVRTIRISQNPANDRSGFASVGATPRLSRDGRFVYFDTLTALVAEDVNGSPDGYLYDRDTDGNGVFDEPGHAGLSLVTTGSGNALAIGGTSSVEQLSTDGRYVLFSSTATNLSPGTGGNNQCYRKDRLTSVTVLASSAPDGTPLSALSCAMSPNGRSVVLAGWFPPLSGGQTNARWLLRDLETNGYVPIVYPDPAALPLQTASSIGAGLGGLVWGIGAGFSPDGTLVYLEDGSFTSGFSGAGRTGGTLEYDVAAGRVTQRLPGILVDRSSAFRDGHSFALTGAINLTPSSFVVGVTRYDRTTRRATGLVSGESCASTASSTRVLYYPGFCGSGNGQVLLDTQYGTPLPFANPNVFGTLTANGSAEIFDFRRGYDPAGRRGHQRRP